MKRVLIALFATVAISTGMMLAEVRLLDGTSAPLENLESKGDRVLLKSKRGQAWVPNAWLVNDQLDLVAYQAALANAELVLKRGDYEAAYQALVDLVAQNPIHIRARKVLAKALRWRGRLEAALMIVQGLIDEAQQDKDRRPEFELLQERAELVVLLGDKKAARSAFSALRASRKGRVLERQYSKQLSGGKVVVFLKPEPAIFSRESRARERQTYNHDYGSNALAAEVAAEIEQHFNASPYGNIGAGEFVKRIRLVTKAAKDVRNEFAEGGPASEYANQIQELDLALAVEKKRWLSLFDWQKKLELKVLARLLRDRFPRAHCRVQLISQEGEDADSRRTVARATYLRGDQQRPQVLLLTDQNLEADRQRNLVKTLEDYQKERRNRNR